LRRQRGAEAQQCQPGEQAGHGNAPPALQACPAVQAKQVEIRISVSISVLFLSMKGGGREFKLAGQRPAQVGFTFVGYAAGRPDYSLPLS